MEGHILLVEDDTNMREILSLFLEESGFRVTSVSSGEEAITLLTSSNDENQPYDVVCTDIIMGAVDGVEVMNAARCLPLPPEVILLTGHASLETAIAAVRAGAFDYLQKPCHPTRLLERVYAAMQHWAASPHQNADSSEASLPEEPATPPDERAQAANTDSALPEEGKDDASPSDRYLQVGALRIDTYRHNVWFENQSLYFTPTEYKILLFLAERPGRVASFSEIISYARGYSVDEEDARGLLRWHIRNLRQRFDRRYLVSVRGVGFMLVDPNEDKQ